jgi:hypothetical protein
MTTIPAVRVPKSRSAAVQALAAVTGAAAAALLGLAGTAHPVSFTTVRGGVVDPFRAGVYRYDSMFSGAGNRGTDAVTLAIALPLLVISVLGYRRGSLRHPRRVDAMPVNGPVPPLEAGRIVEPNSPIPTRNCTPDQR